MPFETLKLPRFSSPVLRWTERADKAKSTDLPTLAADREEASLLKEQLDRLIATANRRLAEATDPPLVPPHNADWIWRPDLWAGPAPLTHLTSLAQKADLDETVTLFHDCSLSEICCGQTASGSTDRQTHALDIRVFHFDGTFLSLAMDLPEDGIQGLGRSHIVQVDLSFETEAPLDVFARLNVKHGPNIGQMIQEMDPALPDQRFEFDMAYSNLRERPVDRMWIDVIFEKPRMNRIVLHDLTITRRHRAQL